MNSYPLVTHTYSAEDGTKQDLPIFLWGHTESASLDTWEFYVPLALSPLPFLESFSLAQSYFYFTGASCGQALNP